MALQKSERLRRYLTRNNNERLNALIKNQLRVKDVSRYFQASKQLTYRVLEELGYDDIQERRYAYIKEQSHYAYQLLSEGIPLDFLWDKGELDCFQGYTSRKQSINTFKQLIIRKFRKYGIIEEDDLDVLKRIMVSSKLKSYVESLQIGWLLKTKKLSNVDVAYYINTSNTRVVNIHDNIDYLNSPLPKLPDVLVDTIYRNIVICLDFRAHSSIDKLVADYELDEKIIRYILESTDKYVHDCMGLSNMSVTNR